MQFRQMCFNQCLHFVANIFFGNSLSDFDQTADVTRLTVKKRLHLKIFAHDLLSGYMLQLGYKNRFIYHVGWLDMSIKYWLH